MSSGQRGTMLGLGKVAYRGAYGHLRTKCTDKRWETRRGRTGHQGATNLAEMLNANAEEDKARSKTE